MDEFLKALTTTWWGITILCVVCVIVWILLSALLYRCFFKRFYDILLSGLAIIILSPLLLLLTVVGAIKMKGNPFFTQKRPGRIRKKTGEEKIFSLVKFRTMTCEKDENGNLLPDAERLTRYGRFLRSTSLDELPEIFNIFAGQMSIIGPRPLLVRYLPLYNAEQRERHKVRPGLTGWAQVNGRNAISWEQKFKYDIEYVKHITLWRDIKIFFMTIGKVFKRSGISQQGEATMEYFTGNKQTNVLILSCGRRVELVNAFKQTRDKLNVSGKVYAADVSPTAPALYFADGHYLIPRIGADGYIEKIVELCESLRISLVVPTIDTELPVLARARTEIEKTGAKLLLCDASVVDICCDKALTAKFFAERGFAAPKTFTVDEIKSKAYKFPLFIKPADGSSSIDAFAVNSEKELEFFCDYVKNPIVQECVTGDEYTVDIFSDFDGKVITVVPRKRLATRGGEILKGTVVKNRTIIESAKRLAEALGSVGHITVQGFLTEADEFVFIEINPRFGGGAPMGFKAGANSPENLYRLLRGEKLEYNESYRDGVTFSRFDDSIEIEQ